MRYDHRAETQHPRAPCHPQEDTKGVNVGGGVMYTTYYYFYYYYYYYYYYY